ncbi:MAG TPA: hypothetical protein VGL92_13020 [Acidimicrobiia bacterium]|jgi:hypothetical protein
MSQRSALLAVGLLGFFVSVAPVGRAEPSTVCTGREVFRVAPGLSMQPTTGTIKTAGEQGSEECSGPVEGQRPTGTIRTVHSAFYGYIDPDTCQGIEAKAYADHSIPTAAGIVTFRNNFTASFNPSKDGAMSGAFEGDHFSGRFTLRPLEGDCVNSPLTMFEGYWIGTWHGSRAG